MKLFVNLFASYNLIQGIFPSKGIYQSNPTMTNTKTDSLG